MIDRRRLASYAICVVLAVPLVVLALAFAGYIGTGDLALAAVVMAACAALLWTARRRAERQHVSAPARDR